MFAAVPVLQSCAYALSACNILDLLFFFDPIFHCFLAQLMNFKLVTTLCVGKICNVLVWSSPIIWFGMVRYVGLGLTILDLVPRSTQMVPQYGTYSARPKNRWPACTRFLKIFSVLLYIKLALCRPDSTLAKAGTQLDPTGSNAQISSLRCNSRRTRCQNESVPQFLDLAPLVRTTQVPGLALRPDAAL